MLKKKIFNVIINIILITTLITVCIIGLIKIANKEKTENEDTLITDNNHNIVIDSNKENTVSSQKSSLIKKETNSITVDSTKNIDNKNNENNVVIADNYKPFSAIKIDYTPSYKDVFMMCVVVSSETGYCDDKVQLAVAHTIINRVNSNDFPNTIEEVVTQRNQYTAIHSYFDGDYRKFLEPHSELWNHTWSLCWQALNEEDFIGGAVAYYNPYQKGVNAWFEQFTLTYEDEFGRFFTV